MIAKYDIVAKPNRSNRSKNTLNHTVQVTDKKLSPQFHKSIKSMGTLLTEFNVLRNG
jgi:hypothetical protein